MSKVYDIDKAFDDYLAFLERMSKRKQPIIPETTMLEAEILFEKGDIPSAQKLIIDELEKQENEL